MLDERKAAILRAVVEEYIDTAQPVGSGHVASAPGVEVSPATVRNDMAVLEQEGYLLQPHTSAGRIPTDKGYRFFVDTLVGPAPLDQDAAQQVRSFFARPTASSSRCSTTPRRLLSDLTDYAAVVVGPAHEQATVRSVQLVGLAPRVVLLVAVLSNGAVEKRTIELDQDVDELSVTGPRPRSTPTSGPPHRRDRRGRSGRQRAGRRGDRGDEAGGRRDRARPTTTSSSAAPPAWPAPSTPSTPCARCSASSSSSRRRHAAPRRPRPRPHVAIGAETGIEPLAECALVVAPYDVEGEPAGTIGVLGPTRMNYPQALAAVAVVSKRLGRRLSEG